MRGIPRFISSLCMLCTQAIRFSPSFNLFSLNTGVRDAVTNIHYTPLGNLAKCTCTQQPERICGFCLKATPQQCDASWSVSFCVLQNWPLTFRPRTRSMMSGARIEKVACSTQFDRKEVREAANDLLREQLSNRIYMFGGRCNWYYLLIMHLHNVRIKDTATIG